MATNLQSIDIRSDKNLIGMATPQQVLATHSPDQGSKENSNRLSAKLPTGYNLETYHSIGDSGRGLGPDVISTELKKPTRIGRGFENTPEPVPLNLELATKAQANLNMPLSNAEQQQDYKQFTVVNI